MKKLLLAFGFLTFVSATMYGQGHDRFMWFDAGLKIQYGGSGLLNKAISDSPAWSYDVGKIISYGGKIGINKGSNGLTIDVMRAQATQPFENAAAGNPEIKWTSLDLYTLFRSSKQLGYFEIGPKFSFLNEVTSTTETGVSSDYTNGFASREIAGVMGFGAYFIGSGGRFSGILGLRFEYGLTDIVDETAGGALGYPVGDTSVYDAGYSKTNPVMASIVFELNFGIGYYGQSSCGGRSKFIML